jgi:protoheme IX farnesyltransferase
MNATTVALPRTTSFGATFRAYVSLTKPWIVVLLLVTTVPAMVLAAGGWPSTWLVLATLIGGSLSAGGANAVNCWYDRDIDAQMRRTRHRPLVTGAVHPAGALAFGVGLGVFAFLWLASTTNVLAAVLAAMGYLFYVFVYTVWLKRRTPQNIVIGGAAGAFPPLVGWAAVTGGLDWPALLLFAVVFLWTPAHFWALALKLRDDYEAVRVPMLPVVAGEPTTRRQILAYSIATVAVSLLLVPVGGAGWFYAATAAVAGAWLVWQAFRLWHWPARTSPLALYKYSLLYIAILFGGLAVDVFVA